MEAIAFFKEKTLGGGYGEGSGYGYGNGDGSGNGNGDGYGEGSGSGDGDGSGYGYGSGNGNGEGSGDGDGSGSGNGNGEGSGYGYGNACDLTTLNGETIEYIDGIPTIIKKIRGDIAKGFIVRLVDFSLKPCFIARQGYDYAHGRTVRLAVKALEEKLIAQMSPDEKIEEFLKAGFELNAVFPISQFFDWHGKLTGSCAIGRELFIKEHGLNLESGTITTHQFIELTQNHFGGDVIKRLKNKLTENTIKTEITGMRNAAAWEPCSKEKK